MNSFEIGTLPDATGKRIYLVGADPLVLTKWYDPDQLWLPFMTGAIFMARDETYVAPGKPRKVSPQKLDRKCFAHLPNEYPTYYRKPYVYEKGVDQYVLPFVEFKRLSNSQLKDIQIANFPCWEKSSETDRPHSVWIQDRPFEPGEWCMDNFDGRFHCSRNSITCELELDALRAKLVFS